MSTILSLPLIFAEASKPVGVESLLGPLNSIAEAVMNAVKWWHRAEGFGVGVVVVSIPVLLGLTFGVAYALIRNRGN